MTSPPSRVPAIPMAPECLSCSPKRMAPARFPVSSFSPTPPTATCSAKPSRRASALPEEPNSNHALVVARFFDGNTTGMAHGVDDIDAWNASDYLSHFGTVRSARKVHCNAWILDFSSDPVGNLSSLDSAINSRGFLVVGGLDNGSGTAVPHLFATSYNGLSVGVTDGDHSREARL